MVADVERVLVMFDLDWRPARGRKMPFGSGQRLEGALLGC